MEWFDGRSSIEEAIAKINYSLLKDAALIIERHLYFDRFYIHVFEKNL
jgi:hypothetical protein